MRSWDKTINRDLIFSLPFYEGVGTAITQDVANPHHPVSLNNAPTWTTVGKLGVIQFDGAADYLDALAADTVDLNFTTGDYSIVGWVYYETLAQSQLVIGRYGVDLDGWEVYLYSVNNTLSLRHHHVSLTPDDRDGCYSSDWVVDNWHLFGISRDSLYPQMFRNGEEVEVTYDVGGLKDPDTCARDMTLGVRYTKNANWYKGMMWNPRIWQRSLYSWEHKAIWDSERRLFGL